MADTSPAEKAMKTPILDSSLDSNCEAVAQYLDSKLPKALERISGEKYKKSTIRSMVKNKKLLVSLRKLKEALHPMTGSLSNEQCIAKVRLQAGVRLQLWQWAGAYFETRYQHRFSRSNRQEAKNLLMRDILGIIQLAALKLGPELSSFISSVTSYFKNEDRLTEIWAYFELDDPKKDPTTVNRPKNSRKRRHSSTRKLQETQPVIAQQTGQPKSKKRHNSLLGPNITRRFSGSRFQHRSISKSLRLGPASATKTIAIPRPLARVTADETSSVSKRTRTSPPAAPAMFPSPRKRSDPPISDCIMETPQKPSVFQEAFQELDQQRVRREGRFSTTLF